VVPFEFREEEIRKGRPSSPEEEEAQQWKKVSEEEEDIRKKKIFERRTRACLVYPIHTVDRRLKQYTETLDIC
jgi:hypothetical protein